MIISSMTTDHNYTMPQQYKVYFKGGATKRDVGSNPFDDNDPDDSASADCTDGQKTVKVTHENGTSSDYCVDCTAGILHFLFRAS